MYVRSAATPPDASLAPPTSQSRYIIFRHPGYDDARNVLLKLFAPDALLSSSSSPSSGFGLHAGYALTACGIVAGNRWDGWLSEHRHHNRDGDELTRITFGDVDRDKMLDKHSYYFHLPCNDDGDDDALSPPYPIVPTFREWPFPHDHLPPSWSQTTPFEPPEQPQTYSVSGLTTVLRQRDVTCRITGHREVLQIAHVCPQAEEDWYLRNGMPRYNAGNTESVDNPANALLLRADMHIAFDKPSFVLVPKPVNVELQQFVLHLFEPSREFESLYHNRAMQSLEVNVEFLFARFAWTIFPLLASFLKCKVQRRLRLSTTINEANSAEMTPIFASAEQCENFITKTPKSRNSSPKKRGRTEDSIADGNIGSLREEEYQQPRKRHRHSGPAHGLVNIKTASVEAPSLNESSPATPGATSLQQEWLQQERLRSDTDLRWEKEVAWAAEVYKGGITLGEANARRWLEFNGGELEDCRLLKVIEDGSIE
ncbi:hypothetical protein B0O99DRAFT_692824 [Bisporella sp. PMI_857]|nr:hypothetical protein B0O99DRAFT_692824 [Bisporella sp. PMI_857]